MKSFYTMLVFVVISGLTISLVKAQTSATPMRPLEKANPWKDSQLIEPAGLADVINNPKTDVPVIFNIGSVEDVKDAKHIGPVSNVAEMEKFKREVNSLPRNSEIIIYCGCCPFAKCPNIRPAFFELTKLGFTNIKVLNLAANLKTNWISKGYPLANN
ncbi:MAG TPA: rhodanese-like domain-containing protein [Mucilaginibacter sp.]|jgi:hypothetical protein